MKEITINQRYKVSVPDWQAEWDGWSEWERRRFMSMESELKQGDVLYDVGAEDGVISAIYAQFVGAENMCLFEPAIESWPNIHEIWELNNLSDPLACFQGFVDQMTNLNRVVTKGWPETDTEPLEKRKVYKYLFEDNADIPAITLDDWASWLGTGPNAVTIDVEGAEMRVLRGAANLLAYVRPIFWISVHPDLMMKNYGESDDDVHRFMRLKGYAGELLGVDHEQHYIYRPI